MRTQSINLGAVSVLQAGSLILFVTLAALGVIVFAGLRQINGFVFTIVAGIVVFGMVMAAVLYVLSRRISTALYRLHEGIDKKEIDKAKSDFISIASHQLQTPLTGIRWILEQMLKKEKLSDKGKEYLNDLALSAAQLSSLINILLNVSRIEAGIAIVPKPLEIVSFVASYLGDCSPLCGRKNLELIFNKPKSEINVVTDPAAFRNIIQGLVSNAIEYTPEGGRIEIALENKKDNFFIKVADTGIGIPKEFQRKMFEKFYRADNAKLVKPDGTGLGLYIVSQAVKYLGGKIWFDSPTFVERTPAGKEEKGTTFYVELPFTSKPMAGYKSLV